MTMAWFGVFALLLWAGSSSAQFGKDETKTLFHGQDLYIPMTEIETQESWFLPKSPLIDRRRLMSPGRDLDPRCHLLSNFLILEKVSVKDQGLYTVVELNSTEYIHNITLIVRDCVTEHILKYGDTLNIPLSQESSAVQLEFTPEVVRPQAQPQPQPETQPETQTETQPEAQPEAQPRLLINNSEVMEPQYQQRLVMQGHRWALHRVTPADEGAYTVWDTKGNAVQKMCLNVKEHIMFVELAYGGTLKINLILDKASVTLSFLSDRDKTERVLLKEGVVSDPQYNTRLHVDGKLCTLDSVTTADTGFYTVKDLTGTLISNVHLEVEAYKLPSLYVAIISLLLLVLFLLCVCLVSCMKKIKQRAEKARAIAKITQQADKSEGEAFRQVVHEAYNRFTEDATTQSVSQWDDKPSYTDVTEEEGKAPEVSKGSRYHTLPDEKNFLENTDQAAAEFVIAALPLDSDTDHPIASTSEKLILDSKDS
ncbi:uncharacterized protein LOC136771404 isoform X2 [Amia ocellicauda]